MFNAEPIDGPDEERGRDMQDTLRMMMGAFRALIAGAFLPVRQTRPDGEGAAYAPLEAAARPCMGGDMLVVWVDNVG